MTGSPTRRRSGPEPKPETAETGFAATVSTIMAAPTDSRQKQVAHCEAALSGAWVVLVTYVDSWQRRNVYLTLSAAQRAAERAHARGHRATAVLCDLQVVADISGGDL